jgi:hypothetical protein
MRRLDDRRDPQIESRADFGIASSNSAIRSITSPATSNCPNADTAQYLEDSAEAICIGSPRIWARSINSSVICELRRAFTKS